MRSLRYGLAALALAGLVVAGSVRGEDKKKDTPKKDEQKKDTPKQVKKQPKREFGPLKGFEDMLEALGGQMPEDQLDLIRQRLKMTREMLDKLQKDGKLPRNALGAFGKLPALPAMPAFPDLQDFGGFPQGGRRAVPSLQQVRLGAKLGEPSATLIDQLDLPRNQGMVLEEVGANSPAEKVGLKPNDILLEVDGKPVSMKKEDLDKILSEVKADKAVDVVVMRKGKKETLKGLKLPESKVEQPAPQPKPRRGEGIGQLGGTTSITRNHDEFSAKHTSDGVKYLITGKVNNGKAEPTEITIDTGKSATYASLDKVPAAHQEKVKKLLEMSGGQAQPRRVDEQ